MRKFSRRRKRQKVTWWTNTNVYDNLQPIPLVPVIGNLTIIDTATTRAQTPAIATSFPQINEYRLLAIRGHIMFNTVTLPNLGDNIEVHMGIYKSQEGITSSTFSPVNIGDASMDWLWFHRDVWSYSNLIFGSNPNFKAQSYAIPVHVKTKRLIKANDRISLAVTQYNKVAIGLYTPQFNPYLRCLISHVE